MIDVQCGIKAFDLHELICHFVAKELGYYAEEGLRVTLRDTTFVSDDALPTSHYFQVACGSAFMSRREGVPFKVMLVATERPVFWVHAAPEIERIEDLGGLRVATYPPFAPPHWFHRLVMRAHGLDPDRDLSFEPVRDDAARLNLLAAGDVQAAAASSAVAPAAVRRRGLRTLGIFGDDVTFATTGVATTEAVLEGDSETIAAVARAFLRSLDTIHEEPDRVAPIAARLLVEEEAVAAETLALALPCFTRHGRAPLDRLQAAVDAVAGELPGPDGVDASVLYDFSLLPEHTAES
jgi:ABC-type nitrate/sulfonate/bicarbonate transport system substrate-binding protein